MRPKLRSGDSGIDDRWLARRRWGTGVTTVWCAFLPLVLAIGFVSHSGVFGRLDSWQLETLGSGSVLLLVLVFAPLMLLPQGVARLAPIDASTPFLLGIRQTFDDDWGPRAGPREGVPAPLGDWQAGELAHAGIRLAPRVVVLMRRQFGGRSPYPDPPILWMTACTAGSASSPCSWDAFRGGSSGVRRGQLWCRRVCRRCTVTARCPKVSSKRGLSQC